MSSTQEKLWRRFKNQYPNADFSKFFLEELDSGNWTIVYRTKNQDLLVSPSNPEIKKALGLEQEDAKNRAWSIFKERYPKADVSKFIVQKIAGIWNVIHKKDNFLFYKDYLGYWNEKEYSYEIKIDLGILKNTETQMVGNFPKELTLDKKPKLTVPAVLFESRTHAIGPELTSRLEIYVTPSFSFSINVREIFNHSKMKFTSGKRARAWLDGPDVTFWTEQLNFAFFCATTGCRIGINLLYSADIPNHVRSLLRFHVYFCTRRVLYELQTALPGDSSWNSEKNPYSQRQYEKLCREFVISPKVDFRFTYGGNKGLGTSVFYYWCTS